ncbi:MAG: hypothetical protein RLZZ171_2723, partial [Cyanobacteriota bacterium]
MEEKGKPEEASKLFLQAWNEATNDFEKFISAHYVARHQKNVSDKLEWLETALQFALKINNDTVKSAFPSLYSNIAKCYEDLSTPDKAKKNYELATSFVATIKGSGAKLSLNLDNVPGNIDSSKYNLVTFARVNSNLDWDSQGLKPWSKSPSPFELKLWHDPEKNAGDKM